MNLHWQWHLQPSRLAAQLCGNAIEEGHWSWTTETADALAVSGYIPWHFPSLG